MAIIIVIYYIFWGFQRFFPNFLCAGEQVVFTVLGDGLVKRLLMLLCVSL